MDSRSLSKGVIYVNRGRSHVARLAVSLYCLRSQYKGEITILDAGMSQGITGQLVDEFQCLVKYVGFSHLEPIGHRSMDLIKAEALLLSPYDLTVYLDADTIPLSPITPLFEAAENAAYHSAAFPEQSGPVSRKPLWRVMTHDNPCIAEAARGAYQNQHYLSDGVIAYSRESQLLSLLRDIVRRRIPSSSPFWAAVQIARHLELGIIGPRIVPSSWAASVRQESDYASPVKIWHLSRGSHVPFNGRSRSWVCGLWGRLYSQLTARNAARINDWSPGTDHCLARALATIGNPLVW